VEGEKNKQTKCFSNTQSHFKSKIQYFYFSSIFSLFFLFFYTQSLVFLLLTHDEMIKCNKATAPHAYETRKEIENELKNDVNNDDDAMRMKLSEERAL
jgi:Ca2+/H+ antiporter